MPHRFEVLTRGRRDALQRTETEVDNPHVVVRAGRAGDGEPSAVRRQPRKRILAAVITYRHASPLAIDPDKFVLPSHGRTVDVREGTVRRHGVLRGAIWLNH